jgi:hypothetical protein
MQGVCKLTPRMLAKTSGDKSTDFPTEFSMRHRGKIPLSKARLRSAISNGRFLLRDVDGRGPEMRRLRDLLESHVSDLGGEDNISHSERVLVGRASMLTVLTEMMEQQFAQQRMKVKPADLDNYQRIVSCLRRVFETLGLQRRAKAVPTIEEYIATKTREKEELEAAE